MGGVAETVRHALLECRCHADDRSEFFERVRAACPAFEHASPDMKLKFLMSDVAPKEVDVQLLVSFSHPTFRISRA